MAAPCDPVANPCGTNNCPATLNCLWQGNTKYNPIPGNPGIFSLIIYSALLFIGVATLSMIIYAGFKYITSQADKKAIESANKTFFYAALGAAFVLFSFLILNIIGAATGVTCIQPQNVLMHGFEACK